MRNMDVYDANGVNHLEVGNHPRITEILNQIFVLGENTPFHRPIR
ncbi:hypothetical protein QYS48_16255 [Marivirga arenosa]|uniref:Uncharacterized protein n=1 Tax=Marivirga arenosa TaxID=3059076 RepID=A0AA49GF74_9BACT|nr:hypothetical protein [Marivirga sp. ABR2-2]WKK83809.2 hypothetical protein QYS48_16255 [Marivirga sp. ABR2-2]